MVSGESKAPVLTAPNVLPQRLLAMVSSTKLKLKGIWTVQGGDRSPK